MGGGGAMRTVARAAGVGIYNNGIRNVATESFTPTRRAATIRSNVDKVESTSPRLVFGPSPTIEETKQATSELKDALDNWVCFSSSSSQSDVAEGTKTCVTTEALAVPSVPKNAMQAFMMLRENPVAETVVASIASDPNVWHAMMHNEALMNYMKMKSEQGCADAVDHQGSSRSSVAEGGEKDKYGFMEFVEAMKFTVSDWVNNVTNFLKYLFEGPKTGNLDTPTAATLGGSFMALAVMVIMMVVARRI